MARIRTIKPEFPHSQSMGRVNRESRLCFLLMWTLADDAGRLRGDSRMLASLLYPYDDDAKDHIDGWLDGLEAERCIVRYRIDGSDYVQITNWLIHQKIDKPSKSKIPEFVESSRKVANPRECSSGDQGSKDLRIEGRDQGPVPVARAEVPRRTITARPELSDDFEDFVMANCPNTAHRKNWPSAFAGARAIVGSGKATEADLRRRWLGFLEFVNTRGYSDPSKVPSPQSWFAYQQQGEAYWSKEWAAVPTKAQQMQDANVSAGLEWLARGSANA